MENKKIHLFIFSLFVAMGAYLTTHSWGGITYVYLGEGESRLPAAVGKGIDFSELKGSAFSLASRQRILQEARLIYQGTDIGVELGHFITKSQNGEKAFACNKYSTVQLQFVAVGIAESGESPVMEVEGDCVIGKSIGKIEPIWVPAAQLLSEIPANMELQINEPYHVNFKFDHIGSQWPKTW
ncbi:MAG: hypothetical protein KDD34_02095, partial [Bdellovibrionales bacterium]|nr:hypothetical protein [Bdellovibrionales bacterium]